MAMRVYIRILWVLQFFFKLHILMGFPGGLDTKNLPTMRKTRVQSLRWEDPLEKGMATHSSFLAWRMPWTEEPGRL